ncbi:MAG: NAD(P)H-hydrate epimerase [Nitrososphaerota archaeon]|jgi:NAD(P)H-hydrate epimerase|nr:NAD(P)H-hydrate epimerase [Nitrososphaerota archaeon]MDG6927084.1 NAD(P)H-hydrate epimerase [Nitrososphaerota archaeon]MDG6929883.1 NAD(P)H-hydrate epimerase [Nitrososphaerota archaeon]MDG6932349.1 NAD(P)H-hydrate epimerase [Nitrososphaerota archaeon]MDG6935908.1 NAD(P)H-hydrate epimerase [Nitrososphaerota archaeon]
MTVTIGQMKEIERNAADMGFSTTLMMENAGRSVAQSIWERFEPRVTGKICVVCGSGNNAGDALVAARHLMLTGYNVGVYLVSGKVKGENPQLMQKLAEMLAPAIKRPPTSEELSDCEIVIDGIFGTGIKGDVAEPFSTVIDKINASNAFIVAVDVPSGLDPDSGKPANHTVVADLTVTFHDAKPGLLSARKYVGELRIMEIGIPINTSSMGTGKP